MGMVVQHNMNAINAYNRLNANVAGLKKSSEKLSSGYRINRAGDDAAGLAISEKMRSQIKGLNQAIRNSQDGINMIQTFEGAAQETHSILQRMKELASQAANGTYDNMTDRAAIQLEFDQLNDELNQIADTDFNGTVVLNGGEMSDGLKQVDGEFDYKNKAAQVAASNMEALKNAQEVADKKIAGAKTEMESAQAALDALGAEDISLNGAGAKWNTVDDTAYGKDAADSVWAAMKITTDGSDTVTKVDVSKVNEINVTFRKKANGDWEIRDGYDNTGKTWASTDLAPGFKVVTNRADQGNTGKGGFEVTLAGNEKVNAIFEDKDAKEGDTVTLKFTNGPDNIYAPSNVGFKDNTGKFTGGAAKLSITGTPSAKVLVSDNAMSQDIKDALDNIFGNDDNGKLEVSYSSVDGKIGAPDAAGTATALSAANIKLGGQSIGDVQKAGKPITINGTRYWISADQDDNTLTKITVSTVGGTTATPAKGTDLFEISLATLVKNADNTFANIKFEGVLKADKYDFALATGIDASASKDNKLNNSVELQAAKDLLSAKKKAWEDAVAAKPMTVDDLFKGVSKSDSFDNSTARMTYTDNITLQTGARTKDSVNFTFKYNVDGSADMGDLKANLNLSSRADGLNTANLSLANQKDSNYAIDQIDKAINKTSMVRASFGAIQNRLEHKITNLTTTSENLTEAESSIRDTDMASEMMNYTKFNILQQAAQSMLAQANQQPQSILQLLG